MNSDNISYLVLTIKISEASKKQEYYTKYTPYCESFSELLPIWTSF